MAVPERMKMDIQAEAFDETPEVYGDRVRANSDTIRAGADESIGRLSNSKPEQLLCLDGSPGPQLLKRILAQRDDA